MGDYIDNILAEEELLRDLEGTTFTDGEDSSDTDIDNVDEEDDDVVSINLNEPRSNDEPLCVTNRLDISVYGEDGDRDVLNLNAPGTTDEAVCLTNTLDMEFLNEEPADQVEQQQVQGGANDVSGDPGTREEISTSTGLNLNETPTDTNVEEQPKEGMKFKDAMEYAQYCHKYAYRMGFEFCVRTSYLIDEFKEQGVARGKVGTKQPQYNMLWRLRFNCKQFRKSRTGCRAFVEARLNEESMFLVRKLNLDHNHDLEPSNSRRMLNFRHIDDRIMQQCIEHDDAGVSIVKIYNTLLIEHGGDHENLPFTIRDVRNAINACRRRQVLGGDAAKLEEYFAKMKEDNPYFYSSIDKDEEGRLRNVFWSDARSRAAAKYFGDVITFDTTFLCNKYRMPFAPFVGVNHHGSSIILAAGLVTNETTDSFVWLFNQWVECMGNPPDSILTDQDRAIGKAIQMTFPLANHRLCLWHMMQNANRNLGTHEHYVDISKDLGNAVHDSLTIAEFEDAWKTMESKYGLENNEWIKEAYRKRRRWVPGYWRDTFWAGMSSTQRSEGINAFMKGYVGLEMGVMRFFKQFEHAMRSKIEEEKSLNHASKEKPIHCECPLLGEAVFQKFYTNAKVKEIVEDCKTLKYTNSVKISDNGDIATYHTTDKLVNPVWKSIRREFTVTLDKGKGEFKCTCCLFEFRGILCKHIISCIDDEGIHHIPERYVLNRWRKDIVRDYECIRVGAYDPNEVERVRKKQIVRGRTHYLEKLALHNEETFEMFMEGSDELSIKLEAVAGICRPDSISTRNSEAPPSTVFGRSRLRPSQDMPEQETGDGSGRTKDPVVKRGLGRCQRKRRKHPSEKGKRKSKKGKSNMAESSEDPCASMDPKEVGNNDAANGRACNGRPRTRSSNLNKGIRINCGGDLRTPPLHSSRCLSMNETGSSSKDQRGKSKVGGDPQNSPFVATLPTMQYPNQQIPEYQYPLTCLSSGMREPSATFFRPQTPQTSYQAMAPNMQHAVTTNVIEDRTSSPAVKCPFPPMPPNWIGNNPDFHM